MGTWFAFGIITNKKIVSDMAFNEKFYNEGSAEGHNLFIKNMTGLWILQQCRNKWIKDLDRRISWDEIMNLASNSGPFKCFIDTGDSCFMEPSEDMPAIVKRFCKITDQYSPENIGEIARCVYESMVFKLKYFVDVLEKIINEKIEKFYFIGGGTKDKTLCQWMANAVGIPVSAGPVESASIGNLIFQLKASNQINTVTEGKIISKNSVSLDFYESEENDFWNFAYSKFLIVIDKFRDK
jgi:rhamnulokinase